MYNHNNIPPISWRKNLTLMNDLKLIACHYFCPRQPSFPGNVDQYGKRQICTVMHGAKCCLADIELSVP